MRYTISLTILFLICVTNVSLSQNLPEELKFRHYTSSNGLSQRSVMSMLQSKKGYLWFGTRDGLNKFDGRKFTVYRHFPEDTTSLSNNDVHSIFEDIKGNIWVGTQDGLNKYNPKTNNFFTYKNTSDKNGIANNTIWEITQLGNYLYIATNNGLSRINLETNAIKNYFNDVNTENSLSYNRLRSFLKHKDGNLWIANTSYIDVFNPVNNTFKKINYPKKASEKSFLNDRPTLFQDSENNIWLGYSKGLAKFNETNKKFEDFNINSDVKITSAVRSICQDLLGNLWIGSYDGLYILSPDKNHIKYITHDDNKPKSLSQNSIYKIIKDTRGDIWIGTWAGGINYYNNDNQSFKQISFGKTNSTLNYRIVSGLTEDASGNLWIGTEGGGLNYYDRQTKTFTYYTANDNIENTINANNVKAVIKDNSNFLWIGIHDGGLNFIDLNKKPYKFKSVDFPKSSEFSIRNLKVLTLFEDTNNNIWIGTLTGGALVYNTSTKTITKIDEDIRTVMSIVQTEDADVILLGGDNGLESINIKTFEKKKISFTKPLTSKQEAIYVNTVFVDNFNNYWVGTEGKGLYMYNPKRNEYKHFDIENGLPSDIIYGILSDNNGNIWISTNYGITKLNIQSNNLKTFTYSDGLQGNEFNYGSFYKTKKEELFFGGTNGLTYFNPSDIQKNMFIPKIDIYSLDVNNNPFLQVTDSLKKIELSYNQNDITFNFAALSFMQPEKNKYAYKLEGFDKDWVFTNQPSITYTNLSFGEYDFKIKAANNDGVWNNEAKSLSIEIKPPFWQTWLAYAIYTIFTIALFAYIRNLIIIRVKQKKELEREKIEREQIEETNKMKLKLFTDVSHEFRTPLTLIVGPLESMIKKNVGDKYIQEQHKIMNKNAKILLQLINQILDFRKNESGRLFLQASESNIVPFIKNVKESFKALAGSKNVNYKFNPSKKRIDVWFDKIKLRKILVNLISNAFKFTKDNNDLFVNVTTTTKIENNTEVDYAVIEIINFVSVIPESHIKLIFDRFYQLDRRDLNMGSGIGLSLTKSLVELHKGHIEVKSSKEEGTCFSVFLRLGKEHLSEDDILLESNVEDEKEFLDKISENQDYFIDNIEEKSQSLNEFENEQSSILIVEDNSDVRSYVKSIFKDKYNVFTAENGKKGLKIASKKPIDLIISDVSMPEMNGFELCEKIRTTLITSHIPVILLTARTSEIHKEKGYSIGANAYITKPFKADILETRVDNLLQTRSNLIKKFRKDIVLKPKELTITSTDEIFLQKAIKIVEENITNPDFNTATFIELMSMSRTVLYTKLKALTGQNLSTFIRVIKLKRAGQLIIKSDMNISEIAYDVGFNDLKYFRKCFKEYFKEVPTQYRTKQRKKIKQSI